MWRQAPGKRGEDLWSWNKKLVSEGGWNHLISIFDRTYRRADHTFAILTSILVFGLGTGIICYVLLSCYIFIDWTILLEFSFNEKCKFGGQTFIFPYSEPLDVNSTVYVPIVLEMRI